MSATAPRCEAGNSDGSPLFPFLSGGPRLRRFALLICVLAAAVGPLPAEASAAPKRATTPQLIERAAREGKIERDTATLYLAYAFGRPERLPAEYRSNAPWDGTLPLQRLHEAVKRMRPGGRRDAARQALAPAAAAATTCDTSNANLPNETQSTNFYVQYDSVEGGLTLNDYLTSLEGAWAKEVDSFGWARPPAALTPAPGGKYHVRIDTLASGLFGFVADEGTHAGVVGDNPATPWNEGDAQATCMVLNEDFSTFDVPSQTALDATTAHEFNHSIQFGYGAFSGPNEPDDVFAEGGGNWMEDEVYDSANQNYDSLWPVFAESMGDYDGGSGGEVDPYPYWITFRGLTERYGTGVPGGAEQVMQDFWEETSKNTGNNLTAMQTALANRGTTLADAYHAYAVAVKFNKACGGGYAYPYCFEEGPSYLAAAKATPVHHTIAAVGGTSGGSIEDNYALNWVSLPAAGGPYDVTLSNTSAGGQLRGTVACDTGSALSLSPLPAVLGPGATGTFSGFSPLSCTGAPVLVVTNESQTAPNPTTSTARTYSVRAAQAGPVPGRPTYPVPGYPGPGGAFAVCQSAAAIPINGTAGNNSITGTNVADRILAGAGDDVVDARAGRDCVDLGAGSDRGSGGPDNDLVVGAGGRDRIRGNSGHDLLAGGASGDRIGGDSGTDLISGDAGNDRLSGGGGRDRISGRSGRDIISGGGSGDRISGDGSRDRINGNSGNDRIAGNSGSDRIRGSSGRDRLSGGSGNDRIHSRDGRRDRINCGSGVDRVVADDNDVIAGNCENVTVSSSSAAAATLLGAAPGLGEGGLARHRYPGAWSPWAVDHRPS